jgi:anti-sigma B factor antagonist
MDTPERYFTTEVHPQEDPPRVVAVGEIDAASSGELEHALETARTESTVVLDLEQVSFIDSSGLRVVTRFARDAAAEGSFEIVGASEAVRRILEITGLSRLLRDA